MLAETDILPRTRKIAMRHTNIIINIELEHCCHSGSFDFCHKTYNYTYSQKEISFYRGYTGHEHLLGMGYFIPVDPNEIMPPLEIINMNGRIYDPILGQFMQADNNIQTPEDFIGYDRYAYCRNNPLKYTDPSGEFIFTTLAILFCPPLAPMALGIDMGWMSGAKRAMAQGNSFWYGAWRGAVSGAAGGALGMVVPSGGFLGGAFVGAGSGFVNSVLWGDDPRMGAITGGLMGGLFAGVESALRDDSFIDGSSRSNFVYSKSKTKYVDDQKNYYKNKDARIDTKKVQDIARIGYDMVPGNGLSINSGPNTELGEGLSSNGMIISEDGKELYLGYVTASWDRKIIDYRIAPFAINNPEIKGLENAIFNHEYTHYVNYSTIHGRRWSRASDSFTERSAYENTINTLIHHGNPSLARYFINSANNLYLDGMITGMSCLGYYPINYSVVPIYW